MAGQPLNLNLARIVHRLMTSPRGWRIEHLQDELEIAPRTYRKYRQILREDFVPFQRRDGTSLLMEVGEGPLRSLRLRSCRELGVSSPDLEIHAAAVQFVHSILHGTGNPALARAAQTLLDDFQHSLRDRDFLLRGMLADADRMFVAESHEAQFPFLVDAVRAIINRRQACLLVDGLQLLASPLTLSLRRDCCVLIALVEDEVLEIDTRLIESFERLDSTFEYPTKSKYPQNTNTPIKEGKHGR